MTSTTTTHVTLDTPAGTPVIRTYDGKIGTVVSVKLYRDEIDVAVEIDGDVWSGVGSAFDIIAADTDTETQFATPFQTQYILDLLVRHEISPEHRQRLSDAWGTMDSELAIKTIYWLKRQPSKTLTAQAPTATSNRTVTSSPVTPLEIGIYEYNGEIYKLKQARAGHLYAMRLNYDVKTAERLTEAGETIKAVYEYAPGMMRRITAEHRITGERAEELSTVFGNCIVCGRSLRAAESVKVGIGPICRKNI